MSDDQPELEPGPWRAKQVIDPELEPNASQSIVQMVFDYELSCVAHIIFSNYTWHQKHMQSLIGYYRSLPQKTTDNMAKFQQNCDPEKFAKILEKHSLLSLPIYGKCVDATSIDRNSSSRVFHEPRQYLSSGSATADELYTFVSGVMIDAFGSLFSPKEIKKVLKGLNLIGSLEQSSSPNDEIGTNVEQEFDFEIMKTLRLHKTDFENFYPRLSGAITNFLVFFALHTIRHHCHASFGVDGELKFYVREMYKKALEDNRNTRLKAPASGSIAKKEFGTRKINVKAERKESDDEFCEIIEPELKRASSTVSISEDSPVSRESKKRVKSNEKDDEKDFPEKYMLEELETESLPMNFKMKFRRLVEQNQNLRDEINDYKMMIQLHISEKKKKLA